MEPRWRKRLLGIVLIVGHVDLNQVKRHPQGHQTEQDESPQTPSEDRVRRVMLIFSFLGFLLVCDLLTRGDFNVRNE